jgi:hypothetical protein
MYLIVIRVIVHAIPAFSNTLIQAIFVLLVASTVGLALVVLHIVLPATIIKVECFPITHASVILQEEPMTMEAALSVPCVITLVKPAMGEFLQTAFLVIVLKTDIWLITHVIVILVSMTMALLPVFLVIIRVQQQLVHLIQILHVLPAILSNIGFS